GLLYGRWLAAQSEQQLPPLVQPWLSQRVRSGARPHRLATDGAWRLPLDRLLRHDRSGDRRDLAIDHRGAAGRPEALSGAGIPLPHDGQEHGVARARARSGLLATAQAGPRPVRADADP